MSAVCEHAEGATLAVTAKPGAKRTAVLGVVSDRVRISVTAPPEDGKANAAIVEVLRDWLGVKRSQIELLTGASHKEKVFLIRGLPGAALTDRVAQLA